jgi:hypothetical protein|nr:MAG TPA: hypothetical protein [Caudoviricetes sp.]
MTLRTVTLESLNDKHFVGVTRPNKELELQLQLSRAQGNAITTLNDGLFAPGGMMLVGPGRPDKPGTTGGLIKGNEANGFLYVSTDGAGVGAQQWQKTAGKWVCIKGDTGLVEVKTLNLKPGAYVKLRRIDNIVYVYTGGLTWGLWGVLGKKEKNYIKDRHREAPRRHDIVRTGGIPVGFRSDAATMALAFNDDTYLPYLTIYVAGINDANWMGITYHDEVPDIGPTNLRCPIISWTTSEPYPDRV